MRLSRVRSALVSLLIASGCSPAATEDERGNVGVPPPNEEYCTLSGNQVRKLDGGLTECVFADGTSCEGWAFLRGECGNGSTYCAKHGGTLRLEPPQYDGGGPLTFCNVGDQKCLDYSFAKTGVCK
jgi:putative hemolysin